MGNSLIKLFNHSLTILLIIFGLSSFAAAEELSITSFTDTKANQGSFGGLLSNAEILPDGRKRIKIFYIHGIGWTQQRNTLTGDFVDALRAFHGKDFYVPKVLKSSNKCPDASPANNKSNGGIKIHSGQFVLFENDIDMNYLPMQQLGCIDRLILNEDSDVEYVIYRFFWDDDFWNAIQSPFLGYDDYDIYVDAGKLSKSHYLQPKNQRVAEYRDKVPRTVKDAFVTYGISEAAMYIGEGGKYLRTAMEAAICLAATDDINSRSSLFNKLEQSSIKNKEKVQNRKTACSGSKSVRGNLSFIAESMGSRVLFDLFKEKRTNSNRIFNSIFSNQTEAYLLGNQIPLIGTGTVREKKRKPNSPKRNNNKTIHLVAFSDVNDILTYELVPYIEFLWLRSFTIENGRYSSPRSRELLISDDSSALRKKISSDFGFTATDVRLRASVDETVKDSLLAAFEVHNYFANNPNIIQLLLCGAEKGQIDQKNRSC